MAHPANGFARSLAIALFSCLSASADESDVGETIKKTAREVGHAVSDAGEKVSSEIQGKSDDPDGALVKGMRTNTGLGYGPAGCGLGSILFDPGSGFTQVLAATTNTSFGTQTFGITSGTSNCSSPRSGTQAARAFVEGNRPALVKDIARGGGEAVAGLARVAGCADAARVGSSLQRRYARIFPNVAQSDRELSRTVVALLRADPSLACRALG